MKKYNAKYFGIASGVLFTILFLLVVVNILLSSNTGLLTRLIPFIPFMTSISFLTVIGGIIVSFLWGLLLGYLFIIVYNFYEKVLEKESGND